MREKKTCTNSTQQVEDSQDGRGKCLKTLRPLQPGGGGWYEKPDGWGTPSQPISTASDAFQGDVILSEMPLFVRPDGWSIRRRTKGMGLAGKWGAPDGRCISY